MATAGLEYDENGNIVTPEPAQRKQEKQRKRKAEYRIKNLEKWTQKIRNSYEEKAQEYEEKMDELEEQFRDEPNRENARDIINFYERVKSEAQNR